MFDVVAFGSAVVDAFVNTEVAEEKGFMHYPIGEKLLIRDLRFDVGGGGTNTSVAFSRLGFKTGYIGEVGDDENGRRVLDLLKKEKIIFLGKVSKDKPTGYSVILDSRGGERTILTYKGANDDIKIREIKNFKTKWVYFSSLMGESFETSLKLSSSLKKQGVKIAFNPSFYLIKRKNISQILKVTDILILNKEEAELLTKSKTDLLLKLNKLGPKIVVITDRNNSIICFDGEKEYFLKPNKIKVVERTGAGDAFASGFVAGQIAGKTIEFSLKLGLKESESVIQHFGSKNNLIRMKLK